MASRPTDQPARSTTWLEYQSDREYYSIRADGTGQHKQHYQARWRIAYSPSGKYLVQRRPMGGSETDDVISVASRQVVLDLADYVDLEPLYAWLGKGLPVCFRTKCSFTI